MMVEQINMGLERFDSFQVVVLSIMAVLVLQFGLKVTMWMRENLSIENIKT